jgi:hypothetical protein
LPSLATVVCLSLALGLARGLPLGMPASPAVAAAISRPALITMLVGLMLVAVGVSLFWSMGLRHERIAVRLIVLVPIGLSVALTVVLMLDTQFRGPGLMGTGAGR